MGFHPNKTCTSHSLPLALPRSNTHTHKCVYAHEHTHKKVVVVKPKPLQTKWCFVPFQCERNASIPWKLFQLYTRSLSHTCEHRKKLKHIQAHSPLKDINKGSIILPKNHACYGSQSASRSEHSEPFPFSPSILFRLWYVTFRAEKKKKPSSQHTECLC